MELPSTRFSTQLEELSNPKLLVSHPTPSTRFNTMAEVFTVARVSARDNSRGH